jgi:hypothetical protein
MNRQSLDELVARAVSHARARGVEGQHALLEAVLQDPDVKILLEGYDMHDRAEGLEDVIIRDIRERVERLA